MIGSQDLKFRGEIIIIEIACALRPGASCVWSETAIPSVGWLPALPSPLATRHMTRRLYSPSSTPLRRGTLKITREELRIIVEGHILNAARLRCR